MRLKSLPVSGHCAACGLCRRWQRRLRCPSDLVVIPGATHLFPEPGTLEEVARLAKDWFLRYLAPASVHAETREQ